MPLERLLAVSGTAAFAESVCAVTFAAGDAAFVEAGAAFVVAANVVVVWDRDWGCGGGDMSLLGGLLTLEDPARLSRLAGAAMLRKRPAAATTITTITATRPRMSKLAVTTTFNYEGEKATRLYAFVVEDRLPLPEPEVAGERADVEKAETKSMQTAGRQKKRRG